MELWLILVLISALALAAWVLMLRRDVMHEPNSQVLAIYPLAFVILAPVAARLSGSSIDYGVLFSPAGLFLLVKIAAIATSLYCTTLALRALPLTVVGPLRNLNPLFVAVLGFTLLSESLTGLNLLGLGVIVAGLVLLDVDIRHPRDLRQLIAHMRNPASFLLLLAAITISFSPIMDRVLLDRGVDVFTILFYYGVLVALVYWIVHFVRERCLPTTGLRLHEILWLSLTGVALFAADYFYYAALSIPGVLVAAVVGVRRLSNVFVTVFGGALLHERDGWYKGVVCAVMVFGTILLVL